MCAYSLTFTYTGRCKCALCTCVFTCTYPHVVVVNLDHQLDWTEKCPVDWHSIPLGVSEGISGESELGGKTGPGMWAVPSLG